MKKHKVLIKITMVIAIVIGSLPGLVTLFDKFNGHIVTGISSILIGIIIGFFISKYLLRTFFKTEKSLVFKSVSILFITFFAGIVTLSVAWEMAEIVPKIFGWKYTGEFNPWNNLLDHYLLMFIYFSIPVGIVSVLNTVYSIIYLKFMK